MAELANKLHIKNDGVVHECTCYTTVEEATPTTIPGGSVWGIKNNGVVCYVGLWPVSEAGGNFHTPLKIKNNNTEYYVETKVINNFTVTIVQSANQTIEVTCNGNKYTESFSAPAGSSYTVTVTPTTGYTAGAPSSSSGYVNNNLTITASPASKATFLVTIVQTTGQTIKVTCNGVEYTSNFTAEYGATWTATVTPHTDYKAGNLNISSGVISGVVTISATEAEYLKKVVTIIQPEGGLITATCNGVEHTNSFIVDPGATVTFTCTPDENHCFEKWVPDGEVEYPIPEEETLLVSGTFSSTFNANTVGGRGFDFDDNIIPNGVNIVKVVINRNSIPVDTELDITIVPSEYSQSLEQHVVYRSHVNSNETNLTLYVPVTAKQSIHCIGCTFSKSSTTAFNINITANIYYSKSINQQTPTAFDDQWRY